jgi:hypothetical protein
MPPSGVYKLLAKDRGFCCIFRIEFSEAQPMHILVGYGYYPTTTGIYLERNLAAHHQVTFVGRARHERPGYAADVDLAALIDTLPTPPDLFLYIDSGHLAYLPRNLHAIPCPTAAYLIDVHFSILRLPLSDYFDYVFVAQRDYVPVYKRHADQVVTWLPLAYEPSHTQESGPRMIDVGFVGGRGNKPGDQRAQLLGALEKRFQMNDFRRPYLPDEMASVYQRSKIVFNQSICNDINMRVFEALGNGALLVTNRITNGLTDLFQPDRHLVLYDSPDDLVEQVTHYLAHDDERERIAQAGQAEVLAKHTYSHRVAQIVETITKTHPQARSPLRDASPVKIARHNSRVYSMFRLVDATLRDWIALRRLGDRRGIATIEVIKALLRWIRHGE